MVLLTTGKQWASARIGLLWRGMLMAGFALVCTAAPATERQAYRSVDDNGRVVYSEFAPAGIASRKVDTTPAVTGRTVETTASQVWRGEPLCVDAAGFLLSTGAQAGENRGGSQGEESGGREGG
jgi:hypothetical protein